MLLLFMACSHLTCGPNTKEQDQVCIWDGPLSVPVGDSSTQDSPSQDSTAQDSTTQDSSAQDSDPPEETVLQVYLLAGQSNMDGFGYVSGLPPRLRLPQNDVLLYHGGQALALMPDSTGGMTYTGPETSFGRYLADAGQEVALVKHAVSGTDLATFWYPGENQGASQVGEGWAGFLAELKAAEADLNARGQAWQWAGFVWMQGESDAGYAEWAGAYTENLQRLVRRVREETGRADLPVAVGMIACDQLCTYADTVRSAEQAVADADPNVAVVETLDLPRNTRDPWHYDGPSQRVLGQRFAQIFLGETERVTSKTALEISSYQRNYDGDFTIGWTFHVASPITLTDIGAFTTDGYLYTSAEFGIWDANGQLLLRDHVPAWGESPTSLRGYFDYVAIEPIVLPAGDYVIGLQSWSWDLDHYADNVVGSEGAGLSYTGAAYHSGYYLNYPEVQYPGTHASMAFIGPNFLYE